MLFVQWNNPIGFPLLEVTKTRLNYMFMHMNNLEKNSNELNYGSEIKQSYWIFVLRRCDNEIK